MTTGTKWLQERNVHDGRIKYSVETNYQRSKTLFNGRTDKKGEKKSWPLLSGFSFSFVQTNQEKNQERKGVFFFQNSEL